MSNVIEQFKQSRKYQIGGPIGFIASELTNSAKNGANGKTYYFVNENQLFRKNSDGTETLFPFIKGSTYTKYKSSPEFMKTLELAFNRYGRRVKNEGKQLISLSGKTKPVTIKDRGTYNIPIEIFDKIVDASKTAGINPKQGLAIAIKESSGYTDLDRKNTQFIGRDPDGWQWKSVPNQAGPSTIVSNWQYFDNSPYIGLLKGWEKSGWDAERVQEDAKYQYGKHQKDYDAYDSNLDEDILVNMFKIPLNRINSGESGYVNDIKSYMNNMSYKYGGKLK